MSYASTPKFCNHCQERVYSNICPYCERKAGPMKYGEDADEAEVSTGGRWGGEDLSTNMISYDELYTDDE